MVDYIPASTVLVSDDADHSDGHPIPMPTDVHKFLLPTVSDDEGCSDGRPIPMSTDVHKFIAHCFR